MGCRGPTRLARIAELGTCGKVDLVPENELKEVGNVHSLASKLGERDLAANSTTGEAVEDVKDP